MVFCTPLSISLKELGYADHLNLSLPAEPLMIGMTLIYVLNELSHSTIDRRILKHPITILIFIQLLWMGITTITSELPLISVKYVISRIWFLTSCYFICTQAFKHQKAILYHLLLYAVALAIVAIITTIKHASYGFDEKTADWIVSPFYNDHTAYGAALAMFIPIMGSILLMKNISFIIKILCAGLLVIFLVSIIISYARAGWLSLMVSFAVLITVLLRIKFRTLLLALATVMILFLVFRSDILMVLGKNNTDSDGDFMANIESMTNISSDVSNLERLNRWSCAIRMFEDNPYVGFGPGTYQFLYAPYQKSSEKTYISTNFGNKGNAHSEYLGPLCEQGLLGGLLMVVLVLMVMFLGYRLVYSVQDKALKCLSTGVLMGVSTYFVHGFLNNFLDTDKASVPFWGFLAILVCIEAYHKDEESKNQRLM